MENLTKLDEFAKRRSRYIDAVQTPLGFFALVVLVAEVAYLALVCFGNVNRQSVLLWMFILLFSSFDIVAGLAFFRPEALKGDHFQVVTKYSILLGPPANMPTFDISRIVWDDDHCFLLTKRIHEKIELVSSQIGPSFRVNIPQHVLKKVREGESLAFELKDKRGNSWSVRRFYLFENLRPLVADNPEKVLDDWSDV